jgi:RNA polymerase sigma factor (sigma-70 family)
MNPEQLGEEFERQRPRLRAVAYRMLGSTSDAEDAVQQVWLRLSGAAADEIANLPGWLTTVTARLSLDMLRSRHSRREELAGTWLPEPIVALAPQDTDPEHELLLADAVGLALLVVLETLTPAERLAFVLHDMFEVPFEDIAPIVGRTPAATRQLASRGRRRVRGATPENESDPTRQREIVDAFITASRGGDFEALLELLDPDVVLRVDVGAIRPAQPPTHGAEAVASQALLFGRPLLQFAHPALVNGAPGIVITRDDTVLSVISVTTSNNRITAFDIVADPEKLHSIGARHRHS